MNDSANNTVQEARQGLSVGIRDMTWADVDRVVREFDRTWSQNDSDDPTIGSLDARHFVMHYLVGSTRARIAELDGRFMGVTLLGVAGRPVRFERSRGGLEDVDSRLAGSPEGARSLRKMESWHHLEDAVEDSAGVRDQAGAELKLFLVSADARGHGVGGALWRDMLDYLRGEGVERFFLHTDSSCDVSYYDHIGMERLAARWGADHPEEVDERDGFYEDIFIYAAPVAEQAARWGLDGTDGDGGR
ncbi:GNAT family N-acetyltransferase [Bifidobacterium xylocopae]|uniref:GNAT family N-acetyltransferase n=1 Tax=Bifidobacterium xylocopae TaxID=2493119 RepID=A0A366KBI1_9BIFI|nr:GNAT family N-acetyltransferase [Bifidobacterium xylocopae]RBP98959.1 GNAT family N-acetyltransferase [Bifidobacterium xylocopae]